MSRCSKHPFHTSACLLPGDPKAAGINETYQEANHPPGMQRARGGVISAAEFLVVVMKPAKREAGRSPRLYIRPR